MAQKPQVRVSRVRIPTAAQMQPHVLLDDAAAPLLDDNGNPLLDDTAP